MIAPIVGIAGPAGAGKDSFADALVERCAFKKMAFADPLREMALAIDPIVDWESRLHPGFGTHAIRPVRYSEALDEVGYNEAKFKYPEIRRFLQRLGTNAVRETLGDNTWTDIAMDRARGATSEGLAGVAISDVRFRNEARAIKVAGGVVVQVQRPGVEPLGGHISEHDLDNWTFDYVIRNDESLDSLAEMAGGFLSGLLALSALP